MTALKTRHERAIGDRFIGWFNKRNQTHFSYVGQPVEAPDLEYAYDHRTLFIEIVDCYYDEADAKFKWENAREKPNAPREWTGTDFEAKLLENINDTIKNKCRKSYGSSCFLLINVSLSLTTSCEMERMIERIELPPRSGIPFECIYLSGSFGTSGNEENERPYEVWMLSSNAG